VARHDLEVLLTRSPLAVFVFDASVGKVHLIVVVRQLVLARPASDLFGLSIGTPVAVLATAVVILQEQLIVPLELVVQDDSADLAVLPADAFLGALVSAIDVGVVRQLARLLGAGIEGLTVLVAVVVPRVPISFKEVAAAGGQRHGAVV
jgi:hypothetical protein